MKDAQKIVELRILEEETIFDTADKYVIPLYQRAYAWKDKEIEQLIDDINGIDDKENYYIGSLVVSKKENGDYEVVDGQQRLTTLYLLISFLVSEESLEGEMGNTLTFDCRKTSNFTLKNINKILNEENFEKEGELIEDSIANGLKAIKQKFKKDDIIANEFTKKLKQVVLYRIEVPEHTDLNRYFEIMNTRGEQLEQHDILKAQLMGNIKRKDEQELFARIWEACSDMTGYVQMHFSDTKERSSIFGRRWTKFPEIDWDNVRSGLEETTKKRSITDIISPGFKVDNTDGEKEDNTRVRFDSIIDFPNFLLHTLRVVVAQHYKKQEDKLGELLEDKKLLTDFQQIKEFKTEKFSKLFIELLLQARFLFDKYFIKREYLGDDLEGEWSLKSLCTPEKEKELKPYYVNTEIGNEDESKNKDCLMLEAAMRVSYTSPKIMHWITQLLQWLIENKNIVSKMPEELEGLAKKAVKDYLDKGNYSLGQKTPNIVFNYLDYLLWKENKKKYLDFNFEFRNSVEHWYPQHPSKDSAEDWEHVDRFGNLCLIPRNINSKFSNLPPEGKVNSYKKSISKGSLKLRIMGEITERCNNEDWKKKECEKHEKKMLEILRNACNDE